MEHLLFLSWNDIQLLQVFIDCGPSRATRPPYGTAGHAAGILSTRLAATSDPSVVGLLLSRDRHPVPRREPGSFDFAQLLQVERRPGGDRLETKGRAAGGRRRIRTTAWKPACAAGRITLRTILVGLPRERPMRGAGGQ